MKYVIIIPDGCADEPIASLGGKTPLQAARKPNMDRVARDGIVGQANNVPESLTPASDVATLSLFGYDPLKYYSGRAPLEAAAMGIQLGPHDWAVRCNLVTVIDDVMVDFSGGHVSTPDARGYMESVRERLAGGPLEFHTGVSYRNLMIFRGSTAKPAPFSSETRTQAPHDIPDKKIEDYLPTGPGGELLRDLMEQSRRFLNSHPLNSRRQARGESPVTQIWLWGQGQAPRLEPFEAVYGRRGAIITAVDLLRGVGAFLGWKRIDVPTATGYLDTDYGAKGRAAVQALKDFDLVCVHIEATDEASHEGKADEKVKALEQIDQHIVGPILTALPAYGTWRVLVSPDHPTLLRQRVHGRGFVPWAMAGTGVSGSGATYDEFSAERSPWRFTCGHELMPFFLSPTLAAPHGMAQTALASPEGRNR
jgi:2,3-bisphosphoglycerate-independent phosphoglycerate mutase